MFFFITITLTRDSDDCVVNFSRLLLQTYGFVGWDNESENLMVKLFFHCDVC